MTFISKKVAVLAAVLVLAAAPAPARAQSAKHADIETLLQMTGAVSMGLQVVKQMRPALDQQYKSVFPHMPAEARAILLDEMDRVFEREIPVLMKRLVAIYDREFSHEDVNGLIAFYRTPLGQKMVTVMPRVVQSSARAGMAWGQSLGGAITRAAMEKWRAAGYDPATFK